MLIFDFKFYLVSIELFIIKCYCILRAEYAERNIKMNEEAPVFPFCGQRIQAIITFQGNDLQGWLNPIDPKVQAAVFNYRHWLCQMGIETRATTEVWICRPNGEEPKQTSPFEKGTEVVCEIIIHEGEPTQHKGKLKAVKVQAAS